MTGPPGAGKRRQLQHPRRSLSIGEHIWHASCAPGDDTHDYNRGGSSVGIAMIHEIPSRTLGFVLNDVARLMRKRFEQRARAMALGLTRAQAAVLANLARQEGINQAVLAQILRARARSPSPASSIGCRRRY